MSGGERDTIPGWWVTGYAHGELAPDERRRLEVAMRSDAALRAAVAEARGGSAAIRAALMLDERVRLPRRSRWARHGRLVLAAAAVALLVGAGLAVTGLARGWFAEREDLVLIHPQAGPIVPPIPMRVEVGPAPVIGHEAADVEPEGAPGDVQVTEVSASVQSDAGPRPRETFIVEVGQLGSEGGLDAKTIRTYLRRYQVGLKWCYEQALGREPDLEGAATLDFTIIPNGSVGDVHVALADGLQSTELEACLVAKATRWRFPSPRDARPVTVRYPLRFKSK